MIIPKKVKVCGLVYNVEENAKASSSADVYGITDHYKQSIILDPRVSQEKKEQTFVHEVLHAIWDSVGLNSRYNDHKQQEEIVDALSNGLYQVFKENKLFNLSKKPWKKTKKKKSQ
jgi:hypothetical protein